MLFCLCLYTNTGSFFLSANRVSLALLPITSSSLPSSRVVFLGLKWLWRQCKHHSWGWGSTYPAHCIRVGGATGAEVPGLSPADIAYLAGLADPSWLAYHNRDNLGEHLRASRLLGLIYSVHGCLGVASLGALPDRSQALPYTSKSAPNTQRALLMSFLLLYPSP